MTAQEFQEIRTRLGVNRDELADMLRVKMPSVWRWEHGERPIAEQTALLLRILDAVPKARRIARKNND